MFITCHSCTELYKFHDNLFILFGIGIPAEYVEKYRNATIYVEYQHNGDNWTMITYSDVSPEIKTYSFHLGKELVTKDRHGKGVKVKHSYNFLLGTYLFMEGENGTLTY